MGDTNDMERVVVPLGPSTASICAGDAAPYTDRRMSFLPNVTDTWLNSTFTCFR